ncbi:MAG: hypothetical protein WD448_01170 [Woeseia sp.]
MNKSIDVDAGSQSDGQSTLNGSISVGNAAVVSGGLETVNGTIRIDENARIQNASTVNGSVRLAAGASARDVSSVNGSVSIGDIAVVDGEVSVVNGRINLQPGSSVGQDVSNVNGSIHIGGGEIGGDLTTVNGDVTLSDNALVQGDLVVRKPRTGDFDAGRRKPTVVIGPGARVAGTIRLEQEVELYISDSAQFGGVSGVMTLDDAVRFSGRRP